MRTTGAPESGMVLIAVVWLLALLGGLTMAMSAYTMSNLSLIDVYRDRLRAQAAVGAALELAAARVATPDAPPQGSFATTLDGVRVAYDYSGETARIDLNVARADLLAGLFTSLEARPAAAAAYADQIVALRGPAKPGDGAQPPAPQAPAAAPPPGQDPNDPDSASAPKSAAPQAAPAATIDPRKALLDITQLAQLPGLPPTLVARALPFLTVYSGSAQIDARVAPPEILAALPGMTRERVRSVLALRTRPYDPQAMGDALGAAKAYTTDTASRAVRLKLKASLADGFTTSSEVVILHYGDDPAPYRVLSWEDDIDLRRTSVRGPLP